jgi:hypothetical protein
MATQFFLTGIAARIVAIDLCFDSIRVLQRAYAERKIEHVETDLMNLLMGLRDWTAHRDTMPVRFWGIMAGYA